MSILGVGAGAVGVSGFYPHTIDQSLKFDGSTSKFEITPSKKMDYKLVGKKIKTWSITIYVVWCFLLW